MKVMLTIALYGVLLGLIVTRPRADDIDIYQGGSGPAFGPGRVMFALDLRDDAADILCADAAAPACASVLTSELHAALDLFGVERDDSGRQVVLRSADGVVDALQEDPAGAAESLAAGHWPGVAVDRYDVLRAALRVVLTEASNALRGAPQERRVEVGLMALHADDCAGAGPLYSPDFESDPVAGCSQGAYVLQGFTDISEPANLDRLLLSLAALPDPGRAAPWMAAPWRGHPYKLRDVYLELHRYLTGQAVFNGFLGTSDYGSRASGNLYHTRHGAVTNDVLLQPPDGAGEQPLLAPASDILLPTSLDIDSNRVAGAQYMSPVGPQEPCASVAMVNLLFGAASPSHPDTNDAIAAAPAAGGLGLPLAAGQAGDVALVASLAAGVPDPGGDGSGAGVAVLSYFFSPAVDAGSEELAVAGGTGHARDLADPQRLVQALGAVFGRAVGGSRTLVTGSTLANHLGRGRSGQDIYFALFQPDPGPSWPGNVKKLKIAALAEGEAGTGEAAAREVIAQAPLTSPPTPAMSAADGLILPDALTFWTDPNGVDVLAFDPGRGEVSGRDGRSVTRGGAGQQVSGFLPDAVGAGNGEPGARQLYTLNPDEPGELLALDADGATLARIAAYLDPAGNMAEAEALDLIRWIRGQDSLDEDGDGDRLESRRWLLADPLHSRPLAVSYGARAGTGYTAGNPDIRIFFGTNDGVLHVLRNTSEAGAESGQESWAFIPPGLLGMQSALAENRVGALQDHPYGLDGEAIAYIRDRNGNGDIESDEGDAVWVFIGQRRGGRGIYAFDMTNPDSPRYMWMIDHSSAGFDQLALTFSTPRLARLDLGDPAPTPVLVFAGGYNGGWQGAARVGKDAGGDADLVGNAIYVVDPETGGLIWAAVGPDGAAAPDPGEQLLYVAELVHSIPAPVTVIDADRNGVDDRAYVGDSGGNVWRIELTEYARRQPGTAATGASNWYLTRLARLGGNGDSERRFFHAADVVQSRDRTGDYDGVVLLSGNRAAPRDTLVRNFAYLLKDRNTAGAAQGQAPAPITQDQLADITAACAAEAAPECAEADLAQGWKLALQAPGEKGLSTPLVSNGRVLFTSYVPAAGDDADNDPENSQETGPGACAAPEGAGRIYGVNLHSGAPALTLEGKLKLTEDEQDGDEEAVHFLTIGPGISGDVVPLGDGVLIPGEGLEHGALLDLPGRTWWRAYWREEEVDSL